MKQDILIDVSGFTPLCCHTSNKSQFEIIWTVMQKETRGEQTMSINS